MDPQRRIVEALDVAELLAAVVEECLADLHVDLFQRLDAVGHEAGADHIDAPDSLAGQLLHRRLGVGPDPFVAAEQRLEAHHVVVPVQPQRGCRQRRRVQALRLVRIAIVDGELRHAMKAEDQLLGSALLGIAPALADAVGQRGDVAGIIMKVLHEAQGRDRAPAQELAGDHVEDGAAGRARILRIERQHQDPVEAARPQLAQRLHHRRLAIAHRPGHLDQATALLQLVAQRPGLLPGVDEQRRAIGLPDRAVLLARFLRAPRQHQTVQDRPPLPARLLHHPRVGQELPQVATHIRRLGRIGGAKLDQQDGGAGLLFHEESGKRRMDRTA